MSWHSFSFGAHYDPANVGFGRLVCHNVDDLGPGAGYALHPHRDLEIVTWVIEGELHHRDSAGSTSVVQAGQAQYLGAGSGVRHQEYAGDTRTRFAQMWVTPDESGLPPAYARTDLGSADSEGWVALAGGLGDSGGLLPTRTRNASLHARQLRNGDRATLDAAPFLHLYVCTGVVKLEGAGQATQLHAGDAVRATDQGITLEGEGQVLAWVMQ
ncbi:MAG: pirin family protein [Nocardioidaceae bacterium]|nr:MAG: pirin family protein [Nocardioidaceae bacterium]